jgi:hypothetical protein
LPIADFVARGESKIGNRQLKIGNDLIPLSRLGLVALQ